jgi:hypothetical protein
MITNNFHYVIFHITVQVFHQYYYDEVAQVKCSLSSERWRFKSIINQLVSYSSHKPHSPAKVRCWSPSQPFRWSHELARNHMYLGAAWLLFGLIIAPTYPTTTTPVQCVAGNPLGPNNLPASRSEGTLSGQLNVRHAFNMTRGPTTDGP